MPGAAVVNPARGTVLSLGTTGATPVYTAVANIVSFNGPKQTVKTRDTTMLAGTATTLAAAIVDNSGGVSGKINLDPKSTSHAALQALMTSPPFAPSNWDVVFNDVTNGPSTATFQGVLTDFSVDELTVEGNLPGTFAIAVSGPIVWS